MTNLCKRTSLTPSFRGKKVTKNTFGVYRTYNILFLPDKIKQSKRTKNRQLFFCERAKNTIEDRWMDGWMIMHILPGPWPTWRRHSKETLWASLTASKMCVCCTIKIWACWENTWVHLYTQHMHASTLMPVCNMLVCGKCVVIWTRSQWPLEESSEIFVQLTRTLHGDVNWELHLLCFFFSTSTGL